MIRQHKFKNITKANNAEITIYNFCVFDKTGKWICNFLLLSSIALSLSNYRRRIIARKHLGGYLEINWKR